MSSSAFLVYLPSATPTLDELASLLEQRLEGRAHVAKAGGALAVRFGEWTARIVDFREPWVKDEAKESIARAPAAAKDTLATSTRRIEIYGGGDADGDDDHFNDHLELFDLVRALPGAVGLDPVTGDWFAPSHPGDDEAPTVELPTLVVPASRAKKKPAKKKKRAATKKKPAKKKPAPTKKKPAKKRTATKKKKRRG